MKSSLLICPITKMMALFLILICFRAISQDSDFKKFNFEANYAAYNPMINSSDSNPNIQEDSRQEYVRSWNAELGFGWRPIKMLSVILGFSHQTQIDSTYSHNPFPENYDYMISSSSQLNVRTFGPRLSLRCHLFSSKKFTFSIEANSSFMMATHYKLNEMQTWSESGMIEHTEKVAYVNNQWYYGGGVRFDYSPLDYLHFSLGTLFNFGRIHVPFTFEPGFKRLELQIPVGIGFRF